MGRHSKDISRPRTTKEAVEKSVKLTLEAAQTLILASEYLDAGDYGEPEFFINAALRLRDIATFLSPNKPDWPTDGADIYDLKTKKKVN